ncbi:MAG: nucleotidyltransferase domain-containing protein [Syntrophaceae bacterium]|nr:nucleotidyltransferase domain-containing protein [Syntrophaceae bacterium]
MEKDRIINLIEDVLNKDDRLVFAYLYGSFVEEEKFRDIDIGIYIKNPDDNPFFISSDIQTKLSQTSKQRGLSLIADLFDVRIINHAPFTFLKRIFKEGELIVDNNPDLRTDMIEYVSLKYRECSGLLAEASLV